MVTKKIVFSALLAGGLFGSFQAKAMEAPGQADNHRQQVRALLGSIKKKIVIEKSGNLKVDKWQTIVGLRTDVQEWTRVKVDIPREEIADFIPEIQEHLPVFMGLFDKLGLKYPDTEEQMESLRGWLATLPSDDTTEVR